MAGGAIGEGLVFGVDEAFFGSTIFVWFMAGVGVLLGVGFAAWTAIELVSRAT